MVEFKDIWQKKNLSIIKIPKKSMVLNFKYIFFLQEQKKMFLTEYQLPDNSNILFLKRIFSLTRILKIFNLISFFISFYFQHPS